MPRVTHIISGLEDGGAEGVLTRICCVQSNIQHQVISLTTEGKHGPILQAAGIPVTALNLRASWRLPIALRNLVGAIKRSNPDIVQTWMYHGDLLGGIAARLAGVKAVVWNIRHTDLPFRATKRSTIAVAYMSALTSRLIPDRIICCGDRSREVHIRLGYAGKKMITIKNGIDTQRFSQREASEYQFRKELDIKSGAFVIGCVARFAAQKDHLTLFRAVKTVRDMGVEAALILVGPGMDAKNGSLISMLRGAKIEENTFLCGPRADINTIMSELSIHVLSSSHGEGSPNVVAEAMASGVPCIVTDVGDAAEIVGDTGWVVPLRQPDKLAEAILFAASEMSNVMEWRSRKEAARSRINEGFTLQAMVSQYEVLWRELFEKVTERERGRK